MDAPAGYEISLFDPSCQDAVRRLAEAILCVEYQVLDSLDGQADLQDIAGAYAPPESRFLVAYEDGQVVGTAGLRHLSGEDCELRRLYVRRDRRRQGIGSALVAHLMSFVRERGYRNVWLEVQPEMKHTVDRYWRYGFIRPENLDRAPRSGEFLVIRC